MKITNLAEALNLIPEYWPLVPGVDSLRSGDSELVNGMWYINGRDLELCPQGQYRRMIPSSVRESEARWILLKKFYSLQMIYDIASILSRFHHESGKMHVLNSYFDSQRIEKFGGVKSLIQMLTEGPGALWRWVGEDRK